MANFYSTNFEKNLSYVNLDVTISQFPTCYTNTTPLLRNIKSIGYFPNTLYSSYQLDYMTRPKLGLCLMQLNEELYMMMTMMTMMI